MKLLKSLYTASLLFTLVFSGCGEAEYTNPVNDDGKDVYVYDLDLNLGGLSRAEAQFPDGACTYYSFSTASGTVVGRAVYSEAGQLWKLETTSQLAANSFGQVSVYYFGPDMQESDLSKPLTLNPEYPVYVAKDTDYRITGSLVSIQATLKPNGARLRIKGYVDVGLNTTVAVEGLEYRNSLDLSSQEMTFSKLSGFKMSETEPGDNYYYSPYYTVDSNCPSTLTSDEYAIRFKKPNRHYVDCYSLKTYLPLVKWGNTSTLDIDDPAWSPYYESTTSYKFSMTSSTQESCSKLIDSRIYTWRGMHFNMSIHIDEIYAETPADRALYIDYLFGANSVLDEIDISEISVGKTYDIDSYYFWGGRYSSGYCNGYLYCKGMKVTVSNIKISNF